MLMLVAKSLNIDPSELLDYDAAMAGLRKAELVRHYDTFNSDRRHQQ